MIGTQNHHRGAVSSWLVAALSLSLLVACGKDAPSVAEAEAEALATRFGEPVAIQIKAKGEVPGFTVALATSQGAAVDTVVEPLTGVIFKAVGGCPEFIKEASLGRDTVITFQVVDGVVKGAPAEGAVAAEACLWGKLAGSAVRTPPGMKFEAMARFIFDTAQQAGSAAPGGG